MVGFSELFLYDSCNGRFDISEPEFQFAFHRTTNPALLVVLVLTLAGTLDTYSSMLYACSRPGSRRRKEADVRRMHTRTVRINAQSALSEGPLGPVFVIQHDASAITGFFAIKNPNASNFVQWSR